MAQGQADGTHEVFHLHQSVFCIVAVLAVIPRGQQGLPRQVAVVVIEVGVRGIGGELIARVRHIPGCGAIPDRIIGEALCRAEQRMTRTRQPIQIVVPKHLRASPVRETGSIPHSVIEIVGFINLRIRRRQLVEDIRDLRGGIICEALCERVVGQGSVPMCVSRRTG